MIGQQQVTHWGVPKVAIVKILFVMLIPVAPVLDFNSGQRHDQIVSIGFRNSWQTDHEFVLFSEHNFDFTHHFCYTTTCYSRVGLKLCANVVKTTYL